MAPSPRPKFKRIVWPLAAAQTLLWGGAFYLFPALLAEWERDTGWSKAHLSGAFTTALLLSALFAPVVGRQIDKGHGHALFPTATLIAAMLLGLLSTVTELWQFYCVWAVLGLAMAGTLYEPCFAILTRYMGTRAPQAITLVTLMAGFAGTIAFPTSHALLDVVGWRGVVVIFAILIGAVAGPLNFYAVSQAQTVNPAPPEAAAENTGQDIDRATLPVLLLLGLAFAMIAFDHGALISHLLVLLDDRGVHAEVAVLAAAMIGPMQVGGRLAMMAMEKAVTPVTVATVSAGAMALGSLALFGVGREPMFLVVFVLFQGAGFGIISIMRPMLIVDLLGRRKFGQVAGYLAVPFIIAMALSPSLAGLIWQASGYDGVITATIIATTVGGVALLLAAGASRSG